jgi:hypothetical protein
LRAQPKGDGGMQSFHDGTLRSISTDEKRAVLGLSTSDGRQFELRLEAVQSLQAEEFRPGNIIMAVSVISGKQPASVDLNDRLERLFPSPHEAAAKEYHDRYAAFLRGVLARIEAGDAAMVIIEASYGCDLVAICGAFELVPA